MNFEQVIELAYDVAGEERGLDEVLAGLTAMVGATKGHLFLLGERGALIETSFWGLEAGTIDEYHQHYQDKDPRLDLAKANPNRVLHDDHLPDRPAFVRSQLYNDHLLKNEARYSLFVNLELDGRLLAPQGFFRGPRAEPFGPQEAQQVERALPHLRRCLKLRRMLLAANEQARDLGRALDALPAPVAVLDARGRLRCANASAERCFATTPQLALTGARLGALHPRESSAIAAAVAAALALADSSPARGGVPPMVELSRPARRPLTLILFRSAPGMGFAPTETATRGCSSSSTSPRLRSASTRPCSPRFTGSPRPRPRSPPHSPKERRSPTSPPSAGPRSRPPAST